MKIFKCRNFFGMKIIRYRRVFTVHALANNSIWVTIAEDSCRQKLMIDHWKKLYRDESQFWNGIDE